MLNLDTLILQIVYAFFVFVIAMACARRLGVINFLEAMLATIIWVIGLLVGDFLFTQMVLGKEIFQHVVLWAGYVVAAVAIFLFHKKRHIQIRRELAAHHAHSHEVHHKSHGDHHQQPHGHQEPGKHQ